MSQPQFWQDFQVLLDNRSFFDRVIPPFTPDLVVISGFVTKYGGADVISLTINGDQGISYYDEALLTTAGSGTVLGNTNTPNSTKIRFGTPTAKGRAFSVILGCHPGIGSTGTTRLVMINNQIGSGDITTPPAVTSGAVGEWSNKVDPIKFLDFNTDLARIMGAGSCLLCQFYARG